MAGPVQPYLATQLAAQNAFNVPFGLVTTVVNAISTATAAGEFSTTVDCSLFTAEDVSNVRIYLDSLGYGVEFAKDSNQKSLSIDWSQFLDIPGSQVTVLQGTIPWVVTVVPSATGVNLFSSSDTVPPGIETTILTYTAVSTFHISQIIGWGTYDGEFLIRHNGTIVGGGRTSAAERTLDVLYDVAPIAVTSGDVITVTILQYGPGLHQFRVNLLGE